MALADILNRIEADARAEVDAIVDAAEQAAARELAVARARAEHDGDLALSRGQRAAASEAETIRASARLAARDTALTARHTVINEALEAATAAVVALPDEQYTEFFATRVARVARGGESVHVAGGDVSRLAGLSRAVEKAADRPLDLVYSDEPAPVEHGVVLAGDRARVDVSLEAILAERRGDLEMVVSRALFGVDGEG